MIATWAQEDVETLDNLLNNNNNAKSDCDCTKSTVLYQMLRPVH